MSDLNELLNDLVIANRILAHEGVVDAYGHVSFRHPQRPDRFFLSGSRSPELVTLDDIIEYDLDCNPIDQRGLAQYTERPIHGGIYKSRPDVQSVVHNHAYEIIPRQIRRHEPAGDDGGAGKGLGRRAGEEPHRADARPRLGGFRHLDPGRGPHRGLSQG